MSYSSDPADYKEEDLFKVAELHFINRMTHDAIGIRLNIRPRAKVVAMCEAARRSGVVQIAVRPSRTTDSGRLRDLAAQVRERFNLLDCIVVHGRSDMLNSPLPDNIREVIMDDICREAARQLDRRFSELTEPFLAVTYGYVTRKIADYVRPQYGVNRNGNVLAAQGVRMLEVDRFDANNIVRDIARQFGAKYACMPIPALIDTKDINVVSHLPLVNTLLKALETKSNIVVGSLATHHQTEWKQRFDSLQNELMQTEERERYMNALLQMGAVGNIGGWWFDDKGESIEAPERSVVGLGLKRIKQLTKARRPVIIAVGADLTRIPALAVALNPLNPLCNVWIGDEVTARVLLGEYDITASVEWLPVEQDILLTLRS